MSIRSHCGTITIPSGSTTTINYTSCPFRPKCGIFLGGLDGSEAWNTKIGSYVDIQWNYGYVDDDGDAIHHHILMRASPNEYQDKGMDNYLMRVTEPAGGGIAGYATFGGWTNNGFDVTIPDAFPSDYKFVFLLLGGPGIEAAEYVSWTEAGGNCDCTSVGFQGNVLLTIGRGYGGAGHHNGQATAADHEGCCYTDADYSWCGDTNVLIKRHLSLGYIANMAEFNSWLSNGFRLYYKWCFTGEAGYGMVIKLASGNSADVHDFLTRTDTNDIELTGLGVFGVGGQIISCNIGECADNQDGSSHAEELSIGFFDEVGNRYGLGFYKASKTWGMYNNELYSNWTDNSLEGLMDFKSRKSDGAILVMDDADPGQCWASALLFGPPASPARGGGVFSG